MVADHTGALYGTTSRGGAFNQGTVFQLTPPAVSGGEWTETVLYSFAGGSDGSFPYITALVFDGNGALYGTTERGGGKRNYGTVFQLTPPAITGGAWTESVLHRFSGTDGAYPQSGLVFDDHGVLYGETSAGGSSGRGTVFLLTPPVPPGGTWTESVLYNFGSSEASPILVLLFGKNGALYGLTLGNENDPQISGTIFELRPPAVGGGAWTQRVLHAFTDGADGGNPEGLAFGEDGVLYGTTLFGGTTGNGVVFQLTPPASPGGQWTETVLYNFAGGSDGSLCYSNPLPGKNGVLNGATSAGGASGQGTLFQLTPPAVAGGAWTETVLYSFTGGRAGTSPFGGLVFGKGGALFGTTSGGGGPNGQGTVFGIAP